LELYYPNVRRINTFQWKNQGNEGAVKFTIVVRPPKVPPIKWQSLRKQLNPSRVGMVRESDEEVLKRIRTVHKKFSSERKRIDAKYKSKDADLSKYHAEIFHLAHNQFGETLVANWRKVYFTLDGKRRFPLIIGPLKSSNSAKVH
jgi:hypothetical protein